MFDYEDDWKRLLIVSGICLLIVMLFSCNASEQKPAPKPGSYDIVTDTEVGAYIDGYKVYTVIDVREIKGRSTKSISVVLEDDAGVRYNSEYALSWNADEIVTSYENLAALIVGDKVVVKNIDKEWDINNLRRVRVSEQEKVEATEFDVENINTEISETTESETIDTAER